MFKHPVIIFGADGANGLNIARNLGSRGVDVYCVTGEREALMLYSKYCKGFSVVPGIERKPELLKRLLGELGKKLPGGVIFPTGDLSILTLSSIIDELDNYVSNVPDREVIETLVYKKRFYRSLEENGVPHPWTLNGEEEDIDAIQDQISYPVYLRPSHSATFAKVFGRKGFIAYTSGDLRKYLRLAEKYNIEVMPQEIIPGPTSNGYKITGYFDKNSKPLILFSNVKIRQPSMFSSPCVRLSIPISQVSDICDTVVNYLISLRYRGLFGAEVKRDSRDGSFKLLEINARCMGGHYLATACGANEILVAYRDTLGEKVKPVVGYRTGVYSINLMKDILTLFRMVRRGRLSPEQTRDIKPYLRRREFSRLSKDDFIPFIKSTQIYLSHAREVNTRFQI